MHIKDPLESGYQLRINEREKKRIGNNSQTIENLEDYNLTKKGNVLTVFDDMVADTEANKNKTNSCWIVHESKKTQLSVVFISQSYFAVTKTITLKRHIDLSWKYITK